MTDPIDSQILTIWPKMRPKQEPLRLTKGHKTETRVYPYMGPMQAPKSVPPALIKEPKLLHKKAIPVATKPKNTDKTRKIKVSLRSEMPRKQCMSLTSSQVTEAKA